MRWRDENPASRETGDRPSRSAGCRWLCGGRACCCRIPRPKAADRPQRAARRRRKEARRPRRAARGSRRPSAGGTPCGPDSSSYLRKLRRLTGQKQPLPAQAPQSASLGRLDARAECARVGVSGGKRGSMRRILQPMPRAISVQPSAVPVSRSRRAAASAAIIGSEIFCQGCSCTQSASYPLFNIAQATPQASCIVSLRVREDGMMEHAIGAVPVGETGQRLSSVPVGCAFSPRICSGIGST